MRYATIRLLLYFALLQLSACGGDNGGRAEDVGDAANADAGDTDAATEDLPLADGDAPMSPCSEADLDACEYPSRGLGFTEHEGFSVEDAVTGRVLPLLVRVPEGDGPFPVVIWAHGGGFNNAGHRSSDNWGTALAEHGYVVIHPASVTLTAETGLAICELAQIPEADCVPSEDEDSNALLPIVRGYDLIAVLEALPELSAWSEGRGGPGLDLERIAIGGWSGGSRAPQVLFGAEVERPGDGPDFAMPDERPAAAILMSPAGPGFGGFFHEGDDNSWMTMRGPVFVATGVNDVKPNKPELTGDIRRVAFDDQPDDGTRWMLYSMLPVGTGGHPTFNLEDLESEDEGVARYSRALHSAVLAFLDAHLRDDEAARAWLESDQARILAGAAEWLNP